MSEEQRIDIVLDNLYQNRRAIGCLMNKEMFKVSDLKIGKDEIQELYLKLKSEGLIKDVDLFVGGTHGVTLSDKGLQMIGKFGSWAKYQKSLADTDIRSKQDRIWNKSHTILTVIIGALSVWLAAESNSTNSRLDRNEVRIGNQQNAIDSLQLLNTHNQKSILQLQSALDTTRSPLERGQTLQ